MGTRIGKGLKSISGALGIVAINMINSAGMAGAGETARRLASASALAPGGSVEVVYFADRRQQSVRVVRGDRSTTSPHVEREILTFGNDQRVAVLRGRAEPILVSPTATAETRGLTTQTAVEGISRADTTGARLTILGGEAIPHGASSIDLFSFGGNEQFDLIAKAVHGVKSRYGAEFRACGDWMISTDHKARCRLARPLRSMSEAATDSICMRTYCWGARIWLGFFADTATGRTRSPPIIGDPVMSTNGSFAVGMPHNARRRRVATSSGFCDKH